MVCRDFDVLKSANLRMLPNLFLTDTTIRILQKPRGQFWQIAYTSIRQSYRRGSVKFCKSRDPLHLTRL
jgi:hypothetical protein